MTEWAKLQHSLAVIDAVNMFCWLRAYSDTQVMLENKNYEIEKFLLFAGYTPFLFENNLKQLGKMKWITRKDGLLLLLPEEKIYELCGLQWKQNDAHLHANFPLKS